MNSDQQNKGLEANLVIDRPTASRLGITPQSIDNILYDAFGEREIATTYTSLNQYYIVMVVDPSYWQDPTALRNIYVESSSGGMVPLSAFTHFEPDTAPLAVNHTNVFPSVTFSFNLAPGVALGDAVKLINAAQARAGMPSTITGSFSGTAQQFTASLSSEPLLLLAAIIAVYVVLGILYESYIHPVTILSTLPSAGLGALLALMIAGSDLDVIGIIGIVLLIGIVKKNGIMIVDFALEAERKHGKSAEDAIFEASMLRFRPILMTTLAAMLGALPLLVGNGTGSELRRPLGLAIIGGLLVSQVLTLFTTPVIYLMFDRISQRFGRKASEPSGGRAA
jgi:multidrug efflux pump subunit AcrB